MNGPIGGRLPPRHCPICGDGSYWFGGGRHTRESVYAYNDHLRDNHPEYRTWKRKLSAVYVVPILLLFGSVPASIVTASGTEGVNLSVVLLFWLLALVAGLLIIGVRRRGTNRFREEWLKEHNNPPTTA